MALHNCDEVAVAGFGYDMNTPHAPLHYYETVKMSAIKEVSAEGSSGICEFTEETETASEFGWSFSAVEHLHAWSQFLKQIKSGSIK